MTLNPRLVESRVVDPVFSSTYCSLMGKGSGNSVDEFIRVVGASLGPAFKKYRNWNPSEDVVRYVQEVNPNPLFGLLIGQGTTLFLVTESDLLLDEVVDEADRHMSGNSFAAVVSPAFKVPARKFFGSMYVGPQDAQWTVASGSIEQADKLDKALRALPGFGLLPPAGSETKLSKRFSEIGRGDYYRPALEGSIDDPEKLLDVIGFALTFVLLYTDRVEFCTFRSKGVHHFVALGAVDSVERVDLRKVQEAIVKFDKKGRPEISVKRRNGSSAGMCFSTVASQAEEFERFAKKLNELAADARRPDEEREQELAGQKKERDEELARQKDEREQAQEAASESDLLTIVEKLAFRSVQSAPLRKYAVAIRDEGFQALDIIDAVVDDFKGLVVTADNILRFEKKLFSESLDRPTSFSFRQVLDVEAHKDREQKWFVTVTLPPAGRAAPIMAVDFGNVTLAQVRHPENRKIEVRVASETQAREFRDAVWQFVSPTQVSGTADPGNAVEALERIKALYDSGALTEDEFTQAKQALLDRI